MKRSLGRWLACLATLAIAGACSLFGGHDSVEVRLHNASTVDFDSVRLMDRTLGVVRAGELSPYATFAKAYHYGYVRAVVNGEPRVLQPIDFVGETPLKNGRYTYRITLSEPGAGLALQFVVDDR